MTDSHVVRLVIRRDWNVRDDAGNSYGILDVNPDPADPAVLLGLRLVGSGEHKSRIVRTGDEVVQPGIALTVESLTTVAPAEVVLVGTVTG